MGKIKEIALVMYNQNEIDLFAGMFKQLGYSQITSFNNSTTALETALKKQYELFIIRQEMPGVSGLTMIQKIRHSGNYGLETHFFLTDKIDEKMLNITQEFDIIYVLEKPFTQERILQKINHLLKQENTLSDLEKKYRDAKAAFTSGVNDMAREFAVEALKKFGPSEKLCVLLGDIELKANRIHEARTCYNTALKVNNMSAAASHKLAKTYMLEDDYQTAATLLNSLAKINPLNIELLSNAGLSHMEIGNMNEARDYLGSVQKLDKNNKQANELIAKVDVNEGKFENLVDSLKNTHSEKEIISFLNNEGVKLAQTNKIEKALDMYQQCLSAIQTNQFIHVILYNMGLSYIKLSKKDLAKKYLSLAIERKPDYEKAIVAFKSVC